MCYHFCKCRNVQSSPFLPHVDLVHRCSLSNVVLQLMALGIPDVLHFDFMDKPSPEALQNAFDQLMLLDAIIKDENNAYKVHI